MQRFTREFYIIEYPIYAIYNIQMSSQEET